MNTTLIEVPANPEDLNEWLEGNGLKIITTQQEFQFAPGAPCLTRDNETLALFGSPHQGIVMALGMFVLEKLKAAERLAEMPASTEQKRHWSLVKTSKKAKSNATPNRVKTKSAPTITAKKRLKSTAKPSPDLGQMQESEDRTESGDFAAAILTVSNDLPKTSETTYLKKRLANALRHVRPES